MRPLLLHASSSAATEPESRRVIHIEFADDELPDGSGMSALNFPLNYIALLTYVQQLTSIIIPSGV